MDLILLLVLALATYRLSNMLADVDQHGPFGVLTWLRVKAGMKYDARNQPYPATELAKGLLCMYCNSIWIGIAFAILYFFVPMIAFWIALPFALSGAAVLLEGGKA